MQNVRINGDRLWDMLMTTAAFGGTDKGGIKRLALSVEDKLVRDWWRASCEAVGCTVTVDEVGNMFAVRAGRDPDALPIAMGSHLDTQPTGGKFDGILGVLGGLEVLRTLDEVGYETHAPVMLVNWCNEEGSRFAPAMLGSGVHAGVFDVAYADNRPGSDGKSFADAIAEVGYRGETPVGTTRIGAMFELHIEQGPILEDEGKEIGIVQGIQGMRWYDVEIVGTEAHTGTTPMRLRRDALAAAARLILAVETIGRETEAAVSTVGFAEVRPNSRNVIPGSVLLAVDLRNPDLARLEHMEADFREAVAAISEATGISMDIRPVWTNDPVVFDPDCVAAVRTGVEQTGLSHIDMVSGAGHDAAYVSRVAPTTMIFVPSEGGLSHNEAEATTPIECANGAQVLLNAILHYDKWLERKARMENSAAG